MNNEEGKALIEELISLPSETETVEFKENNSNPEQIGKGISALANSANLKNAQLAYLVFGIEDASHEIVGTAFNPKSEKVGNIGLEFWLQQKFNHKLDFSIDEIRFDDKVVVLFSIPPTTNRPLTFNGIAYIRVGSTTTELKNHPERERRIWINTSRKSFGKGVAKENVSTNEVLELLNYDSFFTHMKEQIPPHTDSFAEVMGRHDLVEQTSPGKYNILNIGALLFAKDLKRFPSVSKKSMRVVIYEGISKNKIEREEEYASGYADSFEKILRFIQEKLPAHEEITAIFRKEHKMYPEITIREFVANALIHQDLEVIGTGPTVEVFDTRIEITNPGKPLIDPKHFIDHPPQTRNEDIATIMRRIGICEDVGTGIDRALTEVEEFQLPAPKFEAVSGSLSGATRVTLYAHKNLKDMTEEERVRACYQHCVLQYVKGEKMTNATLRKRLGIADGNHPSATRVINSAIRERLIKGVKGTRSYVPA